MKDNHPRPNHDDWSPVNRKLWLAKHDAPSNMVLVTDLELHVIERGLHAERVKALQLEERLKQLEEQNRQLRGIIQANDPEQT